MFYQDTCCNQVIFILLSNQQQLSHEKINAQVDYVLPKDVPIEQQADALCNASRCKHGLAIDAPGRTSEVFQEAGLVEISEAGVFQNVSL